MRSFLIVALLALANVACADEHSGDKTGIFSPDKMKWQDGPESLPPGAKLAVLEGDPAKAGPFVMRLKLPDGYTIPAHTHPKTERLTVLSGTFHIAMGDNLGKKHGQKMPAGSFGFWEAGMQHAVWSEGETVVQLHGVGPWEIKYVNAADDPRNSAK